MSTPGHLSRRTFLKAATAATLPASAMAQGFDEIPYYFKPETRPLPIVPSMDARSVSVIGDMAPNLSRPVHVNLVLCMDASGSMTQAPLRGEGFTTNYAMQVDGTAAALESDNVVQIIERKGGIGITCVQFGTSAAQSVGWAFLKDRADARRYAAIIRASGLRVGSSTNIEMGLIQSGVVLSASPFKSNNAVVDVSGDGTNDNGHVVLKEATRNLAGLFKARVNGLAISDKEIGMVSYFKKYLVTDESMFDSYEAPMGRVWEVSDMRDYERVMMQKLMDEIAGGPKTRGMTI